MVGAKQRVAWEQTDKNKEIETRNTRTSSKSHSASDFFVFCFCFFPCGLCSVQHVHAPWKRKEIKVLENFLDD